MKNINNFPNQVPAQLTESYLMFFNAVHCYVFFSKLEKIKIPKIKISYERNINLERLKNRKNFLH